MELSPKLMQPGGFLPNIQGTHTLSVICSLKCNEAKPSLEVRAPGNHPEQHDGEGIEQNHEHSIDGYQGYDSIEVISIIRIKACDNSTDKGTPKDRLPSLSIRGIFPISVLSPRISQACLATAHYFLN
eukprot:gnl/Chilomastix_caulleri/2918.p1 GENE.gnl/Chilomastix_caulleri/2918~~gnl/Chilomastix_caulleri/2918.p1  ORF type:complete len:128 (-),score=12.21 gnl/Chilomastix_caulleri/2918:251-634(-)